MTSHLRQGEFRAGVFFLIVGIIVLIFGYSVAQHYQTPLGQIALATSEEAMQQYGIAIIAQIAGGFLLVVGFVVYIYGVVAEPKKHVEPTPAKPPMYERHGLTWIRKPAETPKREKPVPQETKEVIQCPFCGEELPSHAIYCLKCGKKVE